jgi:hypothetical protein
VVQGFNVADLTPQCEVQLKAVYQYELLEKVPGALELIGTFSGEIWRAPENFELTIEGALNGMVLRWTALAESAGIALIRDQNQPLSISLLVSGLNVEADRITLDAFQQYAVQQLRDTGYEPAFDLIDLQERPLLATIGLFVPERESDRKIFALADRCFAAAYFRRLGLA